MSPAPVKASGNFTSRSFPNSFTTDPMMPSVIFDSSNPSGRTAGFPTRIWKLDASLSAPEAPSVSTFAVRNSESTTSLEFASPMARTRASISARCNCSRPFSSAGSPGFAARVESVIATPPRNSVSKMSLPRANKATSEKIARIALPVRSAGFSLTQSTFGRSALDTAGTTDGSIGSDFTPKGPVRILKKSRLTQRPVNSVVNTPMLMVRANPFTSVAPTL